MKRTKKNGKKLIALSLFAMLAVSAWAKAPEIDTNYVYKNGDLGITLNEADSTVTFKCWAPLAGSVKVLLYKTADESEKPAKSLKMTKDAENPGIFYLTANASGFAYYQYEIANPGAKRRVCDIWAKAASGDSVRSQICNINSDPAAIPENCTLDKEWGTKAGYVNPFGNSGKTPESYTNAIIYEMHIRDWSHVELKTSTGKFLEIADGEKVIAHLKDLGVTHVQILPCFDYAQKNSETGYNWGYNPYNWNVPEGRYVTTGYTDGTQAVKEMRTMIAKLHENGIAVIMDVVYNHTNGTGDNSLYDMTVPGYFYRMKDAQTYSNGSGCGNEVSTDHAMVREFVVESLAHWMLDYHVNGFRFDLMGLHERDTLTAVYEKLHEIDPNVMVYGEPWTGGKSMVKQGCSKTTCDLITSDESVNGVGFFNDDFRDALKGSVFSPAEGGFIQGNPSGFGKVCSGLTGSLRGKGSGGLTKKLGRSINYVECHDNHTLFDKLAITELGKNSSGDLVSQLTPEQLENVKKEDKLAAAFILLAQGTPFMNGGQEFLRTKHGNSNSYISTDNTNGIDLSFKDTYSDVYNTYKALIALRKANPSVFGNNPDAEAEMVDPTLVKYTTKNYTVYFNAGASEKPLSDSGKIVTIDEKSGTYKVSASSKVTKIGAKAFVILQK